MIANEWGSDLLSVHHRRFGMVNQPSKKIKRKILLSLKVRIWEKKYRKKTNSIKSVCDLIQIYVIDIISANIF